MVIERKKFSPPQVAKMFGVSVGKVKGWIKSGQLTAINVADGPKKRPRFMVDQTAITAFEKARQVVPDGSSATPPRKRAPGTVKEFV